MVPALLGDQFEQFGQGGDRRQETAPQGRGRPLGEEEVEGGVMKVSHELILEPADIDHLSITCKSCHAELVLSLGKVSVPDDGSSEKRPEILADCPSCKEDWKNLDRDVKDFGARLEDLKQYGVTFRLPMPAREPKGE